MRFSQPFHRLGVAFYSSLSIFVVFSTLWLSGFRGTYTLILDRLGVPAFRFPFLDTSAILAALECRRIGINVYRIDPCDVLGRPHVYSPLWLRLDWLPVSTTWTPYVGLTFVALFLWALTKLPRVHGRIGSALMILACISPPVLFAMERGNNDLLIFAMTTAAATLWLRESYSRTAGYAIILLAAALKYYPIVLLILALREPPRRCLMVIGAAIAILGSALLFDLSEVVTALKLVPRFGSPFGGAFGARVFPSGLAALFGWPHFAALVLEAVLLTAAILTVTRQGGKIHTSPERLPNAVGAFLTCGSAIIVGCFILAENVGYREISFIFIIPGLIYLSDLQHPSGRLAAITLGLVMWLLWVPVLQVATSSATLQLVIWLLREASSWWVVTVLSAILYETLRTSPLAQRSFNAPLITQAPGTPK